MATHSLNNIIRRVAEIQSQISLDQIRLAGRTALAFKALQDTVLGQITGLVGAIERNLQARNLSGADLAIRSRRGYQWLKFLSDPSALESHLDALQRVNLLLVIGGGKPGRKVAVSLYHQGALYKVRQNGSRVEMVAQESFLTAPDSIVEAMLEVALDRSASSSRARLREYSFTDQYQQIRTRLEYLGVPRGSFAAGKIHHLDQSFQRVNQAYFQGSLAQPHLAWSGRLTHRKFGHYQWDTDTIVVSSSLDQERVPEMLVDYIVYHELLHKKLGARQGEHNRIAHTQEFRKVESRFREIERARKLLTQIAKKRARS